MEQSESLQDEANLMEVEEGCDEEKYEQLSTIVKEIYKQKMALADQWIFQHKQQLSEQGLSLEFQAKVMRAINFLNSQKAQECITYIKLEMANDRKHPARWSIIKKLLGSLVYIEE